MKNGLTQDILNKKKEYDDLLPIFLQSIQTETNIKNLQKLINDLINKHNNLLNTISVSIGQSHQENDFFYNSDLRRDYVATTESFIVSSLLTLDVIDTCIKKHKISKYNLGDDTYFNLQKLINTFSVSEKKENIKSNFIKRNISISGFKVKFKKMKQKYLNLQLYIGIPLLILTLLLIFLGEHFLGHKFNGIQLISIKAILALSISIVGSSLIEGNVDTKWTLGAGLTIRAMGWAGIFLIIYYLNPANPGDVY